MQRTLVLLVAAAIAALAAGQATAASGFREVPQGYYGYGPAGAYDLYGRMYFGPAVPSYGYGYGYGARAYGYQNSDPHGEAVRRIQAEHSRSRYYTHPRSLMNQPPQYPPYRYWGYGY
jgi:hypothetical protein